MKKPNAGSAKAIALQALEQRFLLDGAAVATIADGIDPDSAASEFDNEIQALPVNNPSEDRNDNFPSSNSADGVADATPSEIVFIDNAVVDQQNADVQDILDSIAPDIPVFFIDSTTDGVEQISAVLSQYSEIDAIHIISHGEQGQLNLGSGILDSQSMQAEYTEELAVIGEALSAHGDILLYGCDFAAGEKGLGAAQLLADLTQADVAASVDDTGSTHYDGDWDLEYATGEVATRIIQAVGWSGILADKDGDGVDDAVDLDDDNDGILDTEECEALAHTDGVRFVVGHHTTGILTPDGRLLLTGDDTQPTGTSNHNTFTEVNPDNGYAYTGNIIDFAIAGLDSPQYILATTDGLYSWGAEGQAVPATYTTGTAFEQIALPPGVNAADVVAVDASNDSRDLQGVAAILTSAGEVWVSGDDHASSYGDGSTVLDSAWHQVLTAPGVPLTGVTELEMSVQGGFAVTAGGVYAWGQGAFLGDGTGASDTAFATLMTLHADFTSTADIVEIELSIEDNDPNSYAMLHSNGKLYTLGSNHRGELGQNTLTADITSWGIVQNPAGTADMENIFFVDGQSHSQRQFVAGFVFLADDPTIAGSSETYFMGRNSGDAMTEGVVGATGLPEIPTYYLASYTDVTGDGNVDEADFNASAIALSSHLSVYYDESQGSFAFSGHNEAGAFGQVPVVEDRFVVSAVPLDLGLDCDTDGDGIPDHLDLDSDNDGISDLEESGQDPSVVDADGDGVVDGGVNADGIPLAANGGAGVDPVDSDGDGLDDYLDLDSDNDGIPDVVEGQPTTGYVAPSGMDSDGDGVDDAWDTTTGHGGDFIGTEDTDSDGTPDYLDSDSDGDGASDSDESGLPLSGTDADGDGIDDGVNASYSDPDGDVNTPIDDLENATDNDLTDADYRSVNDTDGDGVADFEDLDDDNDGILDTEECEALAHTDGVRFVVGHHTTGILTPDGRLLLTGDDTQPTGTSNHNTFTEVNPDNGYAYTGNIIDFAIAGLDSPQYILATTDGLYAWGAEGQAVPAAYTTGTAFEQIALPPGVSAADVVAVDASNDSRDLQGVAAILTSAGEVWVSGDDHASSYGDGSTVLDSAWHQVLTAPGVPLTGVTELEMSVQGGFAVTAGGVYAWGQGTFLGDGTGASDTAFATLMTLHADFTSTADIVEIELSIEDNDPNSYAMLHSNGKLYTLGSNHRGELGQNTLTADITSWGIVQNPAGTADMENIFFVDGQSHSQRQFVAGFVFLADDPTIAGSSETYFMGRNSGDAMTEGVVGATGLPEIPTYYLASYTDVTGDGNVDEADFNASAIALSSHLSVYYDESQGSFAFSGHNEAGAFGQVPVVEDRFVVSAVPLDLGLDCDTDGDGIPDHLDLDSDNDGISDLEESGQDPSVVDADGDGVVDGGVNADGIPLAANGGAGVDPVDSDGDGLDDYLDLDSDNDGIPDVVEGQPTTGYVAPSGMDSDGDGVDDAWDTTTGHGGDFIGTEDTDSDGTPDYLDSDSDGDGASDSDESGLPLSGTDADGDGIDDGVNASYSDPDGDVNTPIDDLENADIDDADADYRSVNDKDGDGVADIEDLDDDNDGILDSVEGISFTLDANGVAVTSKTYSSDGSTEIPPTAPAFTLAGPNLYQSFDQGTFGTAVVPPDDGDSNTSETVSSATNPFSGAVVDHNGNNMDSEYRQYTPGTSGANKGSPNFGEFSFVANIDDAGKRNNGQAFPVTDPVYGREGRFFTADPDSSAVPTLSDTITGLTPGEFYEYSFWAANPENGNPNAIGVQLGQPGGPLVEVMNTGGLPRAGTGTNEGAAGASSGVTWTRFSFVFQAPASGQVQLDMASTGNAPAGNDLLIDNLELRSVVTDIDTDKDNVPDACDLDSDNDGISDLYESGASAAIIAADTNGDGTISLAEAAAANGGVADADGDGLMDIFDADTSDDTAAASVGTVPVDSDSDGVDDYLDLDSDNDLIADTIEARPTAGYVANDGDTSDNNDVDGDGVIDIFDANDGTSGDFGGTHANFNAPVDTDGDGTADYLDDDSDNDNKLDIDESGLAASASGTDADNDGIDDGIAPGSYCDPDGIIVTTSGDLDDEVGGLTEVGFREVGPTIGVAKEVVGTPVQLEDGSFAITYSIAIENTGSVDLANLSVVEDLSAEFGAAFVSASNLRVGTPPSDAATIIALNTGWDGSASTEAIDNTGAGTILQAGDSFTLLFDVIVNPTNAALDNQVTASGTGVDESGNVFTDPVTGLPITATDDSDSGADANDPNAGADGDTGGSDDPTPLYLPAVGLAKQAGDAVPNGDNFDVEFTLVWENTGNVALDGVTVLDDIATEFGAQYVGIVPTSLTIQNSTAVNTPNANVAWEGNTALSLVTSTGAIEPGESFEIVFIATIDPDVGGTSSGGLENQASSTGSAVDANGDPITDASGNPVTASDVSDNGTDPNGENGEDNGDGTFGNDPTPIVIPDISVAKEVFGTPVALPNDNFSVTYQLVVENTGNVDLADVSVVDDLATQFGAAFVSAGSITLVTPPADTNSSITLDSGWNGSATTEMVDQAAANLLSVGDSFTVQFTIEVDPDASGTSTALDNQVTAAGDAVDENGSPLTDSSGTPISVTDDSDNGTDPNGDNSEGGSDDPTPLLLPDVGLAKTAGDAVANGDNFDIPFTFVYENTGTVDLATLSLTDDIAAEFGNAFVGIVPGSLAVQNFAGTGTAPGANAAWEGDTSLDLLDGTGQANIGDSFEVVFTVTIDPDGIDSTSQGLENQGTAGGEGIDPSTGLADPALTATDDSDNGTDPNDDNGVGTTDDPTPIIIADVAAAKEVVGTPTPLANGNFEATYQVVIENTGTVDLANLTLAEDLATQFGAAYVNAYGLTLTTPPADASSTVTLDGASWNGGSATEIVDITAPSALAVGDSFVFEFMVEIDAVAASGVLNNQVTVSGDAVDENGNPYVDASGNPISATDDSDSGAEPSDTNAGAPGDNGTSDDPTPLLIPSIGLAKQAGDAVPNGDNFDVEFTLAWENNGTTSLDNVDLFDDIATEFGAQFVSIVPGSLAVQNFAGTGAAPLANAGWEGDTTQSLISSAGALDVDDTFEVVFTVTIDPDAGGTSSSGLENQATSNGDGLDQNGNPLTDGSGNPITATDDSDNGVDPNGENGEDNGDGTFGNDPTPIIIPDISVAKQVAGTPTLLPNGNYSVTYELVTENTGNVALANLSLIEDLAAQYGTALVSAGNLVVTAGPADASSSVAVDTAWNGSGATEMMDQGVTTSLAVGDSFTVQFTVEVDPDAAGAPGQLNNQVTAGGDAVDENGDPLTDSSGNPIVVTDDSDNGTNPNGDNGEGGSDDPTPLLLPAVGLAKTAGDAVANGDNFDIPFTFVYENTGTVDLANLTLTDDIAAEFGNAFVSVVPGSLAVQNFVGTGTAPGANAAWEGDTALDLLDGTGQANIGDTFEVVFTVTIDPDGIDSVSQGLENQGTAGGEGIDPSTGLPDPALAATDDSDNGTDPGAENGEDNGDGVFGNDPTPIIIADIAAAKESVGQPVALSNGNHEATYQVVIENTGTVDLANLTLAEDLATQFGAAYVNAGTLTMITPPADASSTVTLDASNWNGGTATEIVDTAIPSLLAVGDSFVFQFTVEIDASQATSVLENTVTAGGAAVDENGNPYTDSTGTPITATDDSDSGADPSDPNSSAPGDMGTSDDPTPLYIPGIGLAKQAGDAVANGDNFDVEFTLVWQNTGNADLDGVTVFDDIATEFGAQYVGIVPGSLVVQNGSGANTPLANAAWEGDTALSLVTPTTALEPGETFEIVFSVTIDPDTGVTSSSGLENQATSAGTALDENGNPLLNAAGDPITAVDDSDNGVDPNGENGEDNGDGTFGNDPTPIIIPDISVAKQVAGTPTLLPNGNYSVTYELVTENTGNVALADLTLVEDLATQYGTALVSAGNIVVTAVPTDPTSSVAVDTAWNGSGATEMVDQGVTTSLAVGDSFTVQFTVEVDPDAAGAPGQLNNQVTAGGDAVDENGDPLTDSSGNPIVVTDDSDNGTDPNGDNGEGGSDDPTPLLLPAVGLAKTAGDAIANGDNFDIPFTFFYENTGTVDLSNLTLTDDIAAEFGNAFVSVMPGSLAVQNFVGTGTAPGANAAWEGDTALDLLDGTGQANIGDTFEVVFTVTIDPDGIDSVSQGLENQGTAGGEGIDPSTGLPDPALAATDDSDNGTDPGAENGGDDGDGVFGNDPTPIIIADVAAAKEVVGTPTPLANGNFEATYQVVIENTGTVDLANLTLAEDLATQFGAAYVNAYGLTLTTPPADASSTVTLDGASWNGGSATEIVDITAPSALAVGDSFVFEFMVEIDAVAASGVLNNQVTVSGDAVDENGNPYVDASGNPISATDDSDSGAEPSDTNAGAPGDNGTSDDPTPLLIPSIGLAKQAGDAVPNGDNFDVEFTLVWENNGTTSLDNVDLFDDIATEFGAQFVSIVPGSLAVQNFAGTGAAPLANAGWEGDTTQSLISSAGALDVDDTFEVVFTVTIDPDAGGTSSSGLENQATSNGDGLDQNGNPLTDGSGNPITATDDSDNGVDPNGENGEDNGDGTFGNDPTPIIIPDISVAKQVAGTPTLLPNGNYSVTYELVTENTGNVALANLSLIEDLAAQYGTALVSAGNLVVTAGPADASSSVAVDTTWNGSGATEMVDQGVTTSLAVGDSFTVQFTVEVDPDAAGAPGQLNNQVTAGGDAVDENGDPLTDSSGNPIVVTDDSDNGTNPNGDNGEGGSDDPTPLLLPAVGLAKTAGDAVANGDNFDIPFTFAYQNTGTVDLTSLSLTDDIASEFGNAFVSVVPGSLAVQNFSGSGSAPGANAGWEADTTQDMLDGTGQLNIGDTFEVTFVVTIDPDGIDSTSQGLENQGSAGSEGIDPASGLPDPALAASDDSDNGTDPTAENGEDDGDGVFGNDPTPIIIADVAAAKQVVGTPTLLANGNFEATYQVVIENTGTVDLANLTLTEDLATQFGSSYVNAYNLTLTTPPTDATSSVTLDGANWNGGSATEAVDLTTPSMLAVGDWFAFEFTVEIANSGVTLENTVTVGVDAVDENGNPYTDASGNPISTVDDSDSGADASGTNPSAPGDNGTSDDPTPISLPGVADLITVKTLISGDSTPDEGSVVTFAIEVLNDGRNAATGVSLNDLLPAGMTATANNGSVTHGSYDAVTGDWSVGSLAVGETAILTLEGTVDAGQGGNTITNITTAAAGDQLDPGTVGDDLDEAVDVDPNADLVTVKSLASGNSTPDEGETVTFQIVVDNNGAAQATNVSLTDLLPAGLTATANNGSVSQGSYDAATGVWAIGTIADGSSATLTLEGIVDAGQGGTTISNFTTAASGDQPDPSTVGDDLDESVAVGNDADLVTVKSLASGDSAPEEGDTVTFQIVVDNNGAAQATNVSLTDLLPAGLTATANNGAVSQGSYDAVTGIWTIGTLADGGSATLTLEGTVDIGAGGNTISNVTTPATGDQPDPSTAGDDLDESVDVPVNPPPVAVDETVTTAPDTPVVIDPLANDSDPDGGVLTITEINGVPLTPGVPQTISVPNGTVTIAADGTITVTPDPGFAGDINIPYTIVDEDGVTASATHIVEVPNPPIAVDETVTGAPGEPTVIDPLANESDPDGGVLTITEINGIPLTPGTPQTIPVPNATVTIDADGTITVTPDEGFAGDIDVPYTIIDEDGLTAEASHIVEIPSAVEAVPETIETEPGTPVIVDFLANDIGPNGGTLTLVGEPVLLDPSSGTLTLVGDDWVFTPAPGYTGTAVISYVLQDEFGNTAESTHSVVVAGVSFVAPPVAALTPERVYVDAPPVREIQTTDYERREPLEGELLILSMAQELGSPNIAISAHDLNVQPIEGSKGFSSGKGYRGTHSVDPTDECGRFFIDTIVEKEALSVIARSTIDPEQSSGVIGFSASLASGAPLPDWVAQLADGEYLIDRTADVEVVALKLVAHRQDGSTLIRIVEIDTLTGEIREQENASNFGASFSEELRSGEPPGQTASAAVSQ